MRPGTAGYVSPEQIRREILDDRTDIFSLGLVLYQMATGDRAFGGDPDTVKNAILNLEPRPLKLPAPEISSKLEAIVGKCMKKRREDRYATAGELRAALEQARDAGRAVAPSEPTVGKPMGVTEEEHRAQEFEEGETRAIDIVDERELVSYIASACRTGSSLMPQPGEVDEWSDWTRATSMHRLNERYRRIREIGRGGLGILYEAEDKERGQRIALRVFGFGPQIPRSVVDFFIGRMLAMPKVRHPSILKIYDVVHCEDPVSGDLVYLTSELCRGRTLRSFVKNYGPLNTQEAVDILRQITSALSTAQIGIAHGNFKSDSVFLLDDDWDTRPTFGYKSSLSKGIAYGISADSMWFCSSGKTIDSTRLMSQVNDPYIRWAAAEAFPQYNLAH